MIAIKVPGGTASRCSNQAKVQGEGEENFASHTCWMAGGKTILKKSPKAKCSKGKGKNNKDQTKRKSWSGRCKYTSAMWCEAERGTQIIEKNSNRLNCTHLYAELQRRKTKEYCKVEDSEQFGKRRRGYNNQAVGNKKKVAQGVQQQFDPGTNHREIGGVQVGCATYKKTSRSSGVWGAKRRK